MPRRAVAPDPSTGDDLSIGERVRYWRKRRGKSQHVLAGLAGISQPYLSLIESGDRSVERRSTLVALAGALQVGVPELTGKPGDPTNPAKASAVAHVPAIRAALIMREVGEVRTANNGSASRHVADLMRASDVYNFATVAPMLPRLLGTLTGPDFLVVCHVTMFLLRQLGYPDLSRDAAQLAIAEARRLDDPAWIGAAEFTRVGSLPTDLPDAPALLARRAADEIQPRTGNGLVRQAYGMLHLHAALCSAVDRRPVDAMDHLREARDTAETLGEPEGFGLARMAFGPTNVDIWRLAIQLELGETGRAVEDAASVVPERVPLAKRQAAFYLDLSHALASRRRDDEAIAAFLRAETLAPQWVRLRPTARDKVAVILRRTRRNAVGKPLRRAAEAVGLHELLLD